MKNLYRSRSIQQLLLSIICFAQVSLSYCATWYVDATATAGSGNGTSWANAWLSPLSIKGVAAGDTVLISGGPAGSSLTYTMSSYWNPPSGTASAPIIYQIAQDSSHNGTAIFKSATGVAPADSWLSGPRYVKISGLVAGDSSAHFKIVGYPKAVNNVGYVSLTYIDCSAGLTEFANINGMTGIEIGYCTININNMAADHAMFLSFSGTSWDQNTIHDNTILVPHVAGSGTGADAIQASGSGFSIYGNSITGYAASYTGGQHQDGIQSLTASYVKIYANRFENISNYSIYGDAYRGGFSNFYIYNNICCISESGLYQKPAGSIVVGVDGGYVGPSPCVFSNVIIANNLAVDYGTGQKVYTLNNITATPATYTNCYVVNNIAMNSGGVDFGGNATSTVTNNVLLLSSDGTTNFASYVLLGGGKNDYHLQSTANLLIGLGNSAVSSAFTDDITGGARTAWDVGPYAYTGVVSSTPSGTAPTIPDVTVTIK